MSEYKNKLLAQALEKHEKIYPCGGKDAFAECFTVYNNQLLLWFNTRDGSTHILKKEVPIKEAFI